MKSSRIARALVVAAAVAAAWPLVVRAQQKSAADDPQALQKRIAALEAGQQAILKELQQIKALLQTRAQAPAAAPAAASGSAASMPVPTTPISIQNAAARGAATAKVTLIEFSDFECPFCGRYSRETYAQIQREFVDTGKVRYVFRNAPIEDLHPRAFGAAVAGECARTQAPEKFWELHDRMFRDQRGLTPVGLRSSADMVGLDLAAFDRCIASDAPKAKVRQDLNDAVTFGATATPTFFLAVEEKGGKVRALQKIVGAKPFSVFKDALDTLLSSPAFKQ
jgi:protein-disulfide isomerase